MMMKRIPTFAKTGLAMAVALLMLAGGSGRLQAAPAALEAGAVKVTVNYKGKGTVDRSHRIWVWLFDTPDIGPGSMPIAELSLEQNGGVAAFEVGNDRVWIAVAYDEQGVMTGSAPPAPGSPIGIFASSSGAPEAVIPGERGVVTLTFDDSQRMP